jgi:autotransporter-associated beta strand protein
VLSTVVTNYMYVKAFTRTWRASDCASNNASCSQTVTLLNTNAALVYKANNAIPLNEPASWVNNVVPGVADSAVWEATVTGPNTTNSLGANLTWGGVKILNPGGPVRLTGGNSLTLNGVSGTGIDMSAATHDLTIDCGLRLAADQTWDVASGRTLTVNGAVDGAGSLAISDQGVVILNGTNTYAGVTTVSNGVLEVNGLLAGGGTVTAVGGILRGDGIISGPVTVQPNARLSVDTVAILEPTNAAVLAINNTLSLAGTAFMAINRTTAPNSQRVIGITTVTYGGTLLVTNVGPALQAGDTFTLFGATNYSGAFTTLNLPALDPCLAWTNRLAVNGSIAVVANPPTASAGGNQTICSGSDTAGLGGSVGGGATGGIWTSAGTGVFLPDDTTLNASYSPSFDDMLAGSVTLTLTSTGQLAPCPAATAPVVVAINAAAGVSTGGDQTICAGNCTGGLGGSVNGCATNGLWTSSGSGAFAPNATTLNATYCPSAADMAAGSVTLRLTSSGPCAPCPDTTVQVVVTVVTCSRTNRVQSISNNHNGTFTLNFVGTPGAKYYVVASGSIKAHMADWLLVVGSTNTASGPSGTWSCVVSNPVPAYYRPVAVNPAP